MNSKILTFYLLFIIGSADAQYVGSSMVNEDKLNAWDLENKDEYAGIYSFGNKETQSKLAIFINNNQILAQIAVSTYSNEKKVWITVYKNLSKVNIKKGRFMSDQHTGRFVIYNEKKALLIDNPWQSIQPGKYEVGLYDGENKFFVEGDYPEARLKLMDSNDLKRYSSHELFLMKNEIFARYGLIFKAGSELDKHFRRQEWYNPIHTDVSTFLTNIEKHNVRLIIRTEK